MSQPPLPNFFIVGTGKAGTTSLYSYLRQHPRIYMSPVKEPAYFASEIRAEALSEPIQRHVALQSLQLPKALPQVLNDGEAFKPFGWIADEWEDYARLFQGVNGEKAIGGLHYFLKKSGLWYPLKNLVPSRLVLSLRQLAFRRGKSLTMTPEERRYLIDYYRDDIQHRGSALCHIPSRDTHKP